jgi:hypothetical protein
MAVIFLSPVHITSQVKVSYILYILSDVYFKYVSLYIIYTHTHTFIYIYIYKIHFSVVFLSLFTVPVHSIVHTSISEH